MKKIFLCIALAGTLACNKDDGFTEKDADVRVYMSQSLTGPYFNIMVARRAPLQGDTAYPFDLNAFFAGSGYLSAPRDVAVTFALDYSKWDSINTARSNAGQAPFERLPDNVLDFKNTQSVIRSGATISDNINFTIDGKLITEGHNYMVPVRLASVNGFAINPDKAVTYFVVTVTPPVYPEVNRANWTVHSVDSEEKTGEGPNNGRAIFAFDGLLNTFWHTQWDGGEPPLPHHLAIDMQTSHILSGLYLTARQNAPNGAPRTVNVDVSTDGTTWQSAGTYQLQAVNARQPVFFSQAFTARYFRVTVTATHGNTNITFFAEISAF